MSSPKRNDEMIEKIGRLGEGAFGAVYKARLKLPDGAYDTIAVKEVFTGSHN